MKHASPATLDLLEPLLAEIRALGGGLKEKSRGIFYMKGRAFLHFHEDPKGLFGDVGRAGGGAGGRAGAARGLPLPRVGGRGGPSAGEPMVERASPKRGGSIVRPMAQLSEQKLRR